MMPIWEIIKTLQTLLQDTTEVARLPHQNTIFLQFLPCIAQHPSAFTSRCPTKKEGRGALEPPPEDFYVFHSFKPCRRQAKQTLESMLPQNSKHYNSNYLPFGNDANFVNHPGAADLKIQPKSPELLLDMRYFCNFSLVSLGIRPRSRRCAERIRQSDGRLSRPPKTVHERSYLTGNSSSANRILLRPRRKKLLTEYQKKRMILYVCIL